MVIINESQGPVYGYFNCNETSPCTFFPGNFFNGEISMSETKAFKEAQLDFIHAVFGEDALDDTLKENDLVRIDLDEEIKKAKKKKSYVHSGVLKLWEKVNGTLCVITDFINDGEIWVSNNAYEGMFNKNTLKKMIRCYPNQGDKNCTHTIGLCVSGACRSCGLKVGENIIDKAERLNLSHLLDMYR